MTHGPGRRFKYGEPLDVKREIKFTESQNKLLQDWQEREGTVEISELIRDTLIAAAQRGSGDQSSSLVPLLGYIPGGPAKEVHKTAPGSYVTPPFKLNPECYALVVVGDSMESEFGVSIPDGSYAFFCPGLQAPFGGIVHVEWPGDGEDHDTTLKRYCPQADGSVIFEPLNKKHKPFRKKEGEFEIRGVFVRAWDGKEA